MAPSSSLQLSVELPGVPALRWIARLVRLAWMPFAFAIGGRWAASALEVLGSSLLAMAVTKLGSTREGGLPIPAALVARIEASASPLVVALLAALGFFLLGQLVETAVDWCLTWTHLKVNRRLTPEVIEAAVEPATHRLLDAPTLVQRWQLKTDISFFIYESLATTIGNLGSVVILLLATFKASTTAGDVALGGLVLWAAVSIPLMARALRAGKNSAQAHEAVGRLIRDSATLRAELARPSLRAYWRRRNQPLLHDLHAAIKSQGIWNVALSGVLGTVSRAMPIVAVVAAATTGVSLGAALVVLLYVTRLSAPLGSIARILPWFQQHLISVQRLFQVVEVDRDRVERVPSPYAPSEIQFRDWGVALPDGPRIAYADNSLKRGGILCVIGPSGSGKSSLLCSLAGHLEASGSLLVDGVAVLPSNPRWRETCTLVRQEPELVPGGLLDNLYEVPGWKETPTLARAVARVMATRASSSADKITIDNQRVSVGQRRVISVLRGLGSNARVLLLDEPIAGVDDALVEPIRDAILEATLDGKLILLTAHRHDLQRLALGEAGSIMDLPPLKSVDAAASAMEADQMPLVMRAVAVREKAQITVLADTETTS
jgi:ABC-type multidrug transport system fused ATPase/permease subunit